MAVQDYFESPVAYNPDADQLVAGASFQVFAGTDEALTTPLTPLDAVSGTPIGNLRSSSIGVLPAFRVAGDPAQVILKSGTFTTRVTSKYGIFLDVVPDPDVLTQAINSAALAETAKTEAQEAAAAALAVGSTNDGIIAGRVNDTASATRQAIDDVIDARAGVGFGVIAVTGQSLAGGTTATPNPGIDYDFEGIYWWGVTPGEDGYHQINPFTYLPLAGGLLQERPYGVMGSVITARMLYLETRIPQLIIPAFLGGAGFYSHNTVAGRWLVTESTHPNLAQISTNEINLALEAAREIGPVRDFSLIWNQGEADRDISVTETNYASALDALVAKWRAELDLPTQQRATFPIVVSRQLPERRESDGPGKAGVDNAQLATPGRLAYSAVMDPPSGVVDADGTHATAKGQRIMGRLYREALGRARLNRPSMAASPVQNLAVSTEGVLTWTPPASGRTESFSVRYRVNGGAWTAPETVRSGVKQYAPAGVPFSSVVDFEVTTVAAAGNSDPVRVTVTTGAPDITTDLLFDFNADSLSLADGASLAANDWDSSAGSVAGLTFSAVGGTAPTCEDNDAVLPGHKLVRMVAGSLATSAGAVSITDGTYVMLLRVREASGGLQYIMTGSGFSQHNLFLGNSATAIGFRTGTAGGTAADSDLGNWVVLVARKSGLQLSIVTERVGGVRASASAAESDDATQTQLVLSNGTTTRARIDVHRFMGFDRVLTDLDVDLAVQTLFEDADLR